MEFASFTCQFCAEHQEWNTPQAAAAANMVRLLAGSPIVASHSGPDCALVQDAYSLRCAPQVAGAARDTVEHARTVAARELASAGGGRPDGGGRLRDRCTDLHLHRGADRGGTAGVR